MRAVEIIGFALRGLAANKLRSALTTLGILIGVAAVIMLVAVGNGASAQVQQSISGLGTNVITVTGERGPAAGRSAGGGNASTARPLTTQDASALVDPQGAPDVASASPVASSSATAAYGDTSYSIGQFAGTTPDYLGATNSALAKGSSFTTADVQQASKVVVLGATVSSELFPNGGAIGKTILVNNIPFTVIGVLQSKGTTGGNDADDTAIAPITTVQNALTGYGSLSQIVVQAKNADGLGAAESEVTAILSARHEIAANATPDFTVRSASQLLATRTQTINTFTVLLASVAAISLVVGGIGVTNIMLVTVTERIREIGIRKAVGARRSAILGQFLAEATLLSLFGGALGVLVGVIGSQFTIAGIKPVLSPSSIVLAFGVSALIGLFFGSYPAGRAGRLRPIDALRHE